jgi:oligo-1,6-glucosidase
VVYQIYPRSFQDSDGDGVGDLPGVIARLDHLAALGVDVVWLSPIYPSPQDDNGYDISDYRDVDPMFGTLADLDELIGAVHARGMRLIMDLVVNHTSDEHPWFQESAAGIGSPKRDWYFWRPARPGRIPGTPGAEPNDWVSFFSGPAWAYDPDSREYYLHLFSRKQPDLNWENREVRDAVYDTMRWWLDRGVDGFRMDVINLISKEPTLPDGPMFRHVANGPRVHEFLQEMHHEVLAGRGLIAVGETPGATVRDARAYTDPARRELNMVFTFEHVDLDTAPGGVKWDLAPLSLPALKSNLAAWQDGLLAAGWNSLYWNNHDQPRVVSRWGDDGEHRVASAKAWGTVLHLLRGTPFVYQGEELGMTNAGFTSLDQYRDIESTNYAAVATLAGTPAPDVLRSLAVKSRDNARTPMQWDDSPAAGFTTGTPWIEVNPNHRAINAEAAVADPESVFHRYRRLIALRHDRAVVVEGDVEFLWLEHEQVFGYVRRLAGESLLVVANLSDQPAAIPLDEIAGFRGAQRLVGQWSVPDSGPAMLDPWESAALLAGSGP